MRTMFSYLTPTARSLISLYGWKVSTCHLFQLIPCPIGVTVAPEIAQVARSTERSTADCTMPPSPSKPHQEEATERIVRRQHHHPLPRSLALKQQNNEVTNEEDHVLRGLIATSRSALSELQCKLVTCSSLGFVSYIQNIKLPI